MFEITIKGSTLGELAENIYAMAGQFHTISPPVETVDTAKLANHKPRKAKATPEPQPEEPIEDDGTDAELLEPVEPMPETGKAIVDAGTGKPATPASDAPVQMTMNDVRAAAAKLAAADTTKLAAILKTYNAMKLSEVPKDKLADFAGEVMEALG